MADSKISELTQITGANVDDANDELAIVDASATQTKAITRAELFSSVSSATITGDLTVDTNTLYVDSANNRVGIGTSSPSGPLTVKSNASAIGVGVLCRSSNDFGFLQFKSTDDAETIAEISVNRTGANTGSLRLSTNNGGSSSERMRIDSSGNVGIGTSSPDGNLTVGNTSTSGDVSIRIKGDATSRGFLMFGDSGGAQLGDIMYDHSDNHMRFRVNNSERVRIDSSGNLLVGRTFESTSTPGISLLPDGFGRFNRDSSAVVAFNRNTNDGDVVLIRKDGSTVWSIGSKDGDIAIGTGDTGLRFVDGADAIAPQNISTNAGRDNAIDLGNSGARFDDIYATNGTIQTSDRNEKQDIEALSDAEQRVAVACKGLLRKFRWKSAVEEKGDDARIHFGIIAQDLQEAFAAEGLDAGDYAMFISTTWTDEETGEERTRMGVRYSELLAFIIAAI